MHLGMPECHKPFLGHCEYDLWPSFQELLCPEHISYIIWCRNPKFGVVIPLGMAEWCIPFWVTLTLTLTSDLISRFFVLYYSLLSSNVSYARPIPLGAFVTCLWHFLFLFGDFFCGFFCFSFSWWGERGSKYHLKWAIIGPPAKLHLYSPNPPPPPPPPLIRAYALSICVYISRKSLMVV